MFDFIASNPGHFLGIDFENIAYPRVLEAHCLVNIIVNSGKLMPQNIQ